MCCVVDSSRLEETFWIVERGLSAGGGLHVRRSASTSGTDCLGRIDTGCWVFAYQPNVLAPALVTA
jgi:hypothetical protein